MTDEKQGTSRARPKGSPPPGSSAAYVERCYQKYGKCKCPSCGQDAVGDGVHYHCPYCNALKKADEAGSN